MKLGINKIFSVRNTNRRGSAMLLVVMMSTFTMGIWMVTFRSTRDAIDTEKFHNSAPRFEARVMKSLAHAGNMLEYSEPSTNRYQFLYVGSDDQGRFFTMVQLNKRANGRYEANARPATDREMRSLPRNPATF
jgi:hypothetical protein